MGVREPMTETSSPAAPSRLLIVTLDGRYLALDAEAIRGVLTLEEAGDLEHPTINNMRYSAIKLAERLSLSIDRGEAATRVVLFSEQDTRGSIRVTAVQGLLELQQSQVLPLPLQFRGPERHWYRGMVLFANTIALVLNTTWVLDGQASEVGGSGGQEPIPRLVADSNTSMSDIQTC